jgi:hypothetical protein
MNVENLEYNVVIDEGPVPEPLARAAIWTLPSPSTWRPWRNTRTATFSCATQALRDYYAANGKPICDVAPLGAQRR